MDGEASRKPARGVRKPVIRNRNFIYDAKHGFILAFVPKAACTNWKAVMRYMAGHSDYLNNRLAHDRVNGGLHYLDLNGPDAALLTDPSIRKYSFVRNPYTRTLSAYLNKIERRIDLLASPEPPDNYLKITREIEAFRLKKMNPAKNPKISFRVFLRFLRDSGSFARHDEHWQPQTDLLRLPHVKFDYIGRFENLEADAADLLGRMGCDIPFPSQAEVKFPSTGASDRISTYLTPACANLIEEIYSDDFASFDYPKFVRQGVLDE